MSNFLTRLITAVIYGGTIIACLMLGKLTCTILFFALMIMALLEFYTIVKKDNSKPQIVIGLMTAVVMYFSSVLFFESLEFSHFFINCTLLLILFIFCFELFKKTEPNFNNIALTLAGLIYIALPMSLTHFLNHNSTNNYDYTLLLSVFILIWLSDTGGYLIGMRFGKHKLHEKISPKKSWEGLGGGILFCFLTNILWISISNGYIGSLPFSFVHALALAILFPLFGTAGDLVESLFKRAVKQKDSSSVAYGIGGMLDMIDSLLFTAPMFYIYLQFLLASGE